jgi:imidazolonepropionase-like amidohydrolase
MTTTTLQIDRAVVLDPADGSLTPDLRILVRDDTIESVQPMTDPVPSDFQADTVLDAANRIVSPGFIDGHVHLLGYEADLGACEHDSPLYVAGRAQRLMTDMLSRGFTTVRDVGGADHGLVRAVEEGYLVGPRIFHGGPALSQIGGHGDFRSAGEITTPAGETGRPAVGLVVGGPDSVRNAVRNEIRRGAKHIKMMIGGGIASEGDRIDSVQFSEAELAAAVEETANANIYVTGHAYAPNTIQRALNLGFRSIEHATLMDDETAKLFVEKGAFAVPTLGVGATLAGPHYRDYDIPDSSNEKAQPIASAGVEMLKIAYKHGVKVVFGTDFIGPMQPLQATEWSVRAQAGLPHAEVLKHATTNAAELLGEQERLGRIAEGYAADLLILEQNPLEDISVLAAPEKSISTVVSRGKVVR